MTPLGHMNCILLTVLEDNMSSDKHFEYKVGNDVDTIETFVVQLYNKSGNLIDHNLPHKIDKLA